MADDSDLTLITIRNELGEERVVAKAALPFFPDYVRVDSQGRKITTPTASIQSKES